MKHHVVLMFKSKHSFLSLLISVLHTLHTGRRAQLSHVPPWPVKQTSVTNIMKVIQTSSRWRTRAPWRPCTCHISCFLMDPLLCVRRPLFAFGLSLRGLLSVTRLCCRYKIHSGRYRRSPAEADEVLQRHQYRREEAGKSEHSLHQLW